jgi:hypothetical protein
MAKRNSYFDKWRTNNSKNPRLGDSVAAAATVTTAATSTARSMERDEAGDDRGDEDSAQADSTSGSTSGSTAIVTTSASTFPKRLFPSFSSTSSSSSSSSSTSSSSRYDELNARDDQDASTAVLDAAKELRRQIHEGTEGGMGLVIHRFHIRKRSVEEKKKKRGKDKAKKDDYAGWCVDCDVCDGRPPTSLLPSYHTNPPLHNFQSTHLSSQTHLERGNAILSSVASVEETAALDDAAAAAALDSQSATDKQQYRSPMYSESMRRDSTPVAPMAMVDSAVAKLVAEDAALLWVEGDGDDNHAVKQAMCLWCGYTSKAAPDEAKLLSELMGHLTSKKHAFLREHGGGLFGAFGAASAGQSPAPPPPPDTSRLCWGFHKHEIEVKGKVMKMNVLLNYNTSKLDWYPEPNTRAEFQSTTVGMPPVTIDGTFRSRSCARFCTLSSGQRLPNLTCLECSKIGSSKSMRMALLRKHNESRGSSFVNFKVSFFEVGQWFIRIECSRCVY